MASASSPRLLFVKRDRHPLSPVTGRNPPEYNVFARWLSHNFDKWDTRNSSAQTSLSPESGQAHSFQQASTLRPSLPERLQPENCQSASPRWLLLALHQSQKYPAPTPSTQDGHVPWQLAHRRHRSTIAEPLPLPVSQRPMPQHTYSHAWHAGSRVFAP